MCPVCIATAAMIAGGAAGSGGVAALTAGLFRRKSRAIDFPKLTPTEEVHHGDEHGRSEASESGIEE
jgi:hypothetical protein